MTLQWKQRLYAFLLRRILGPYLTPSSNSKLHQSIEVALNEGTFVLRDVDLDPAYLTSLLMLNSNSSENKDSTGDDVGGGSAVVVRKAKVRKLEIQLSLRGKHELVEEEQQQQQLNNGLQQQQQQGSTTASSNVTSSTRVMRNLYQLGMGDGSSNNSSGEKSSASSSGGVILLAHFEIEGLDVEFMPAPTGVYSSTEHGCTKSKQERQHANHKDKSSSSSSRGGMFSSYIESALRSLRLSLQITDISVKMFSCPSSARGKKKKDDIPCWVGVRCASLHYHDLLDKVTAEYDDPSFGQSSLDSSINSKDTSATEVVLYKAVDIVDLSVETGYGYTSGDDDSRGNNLKSQRGIDTSSDQSEMKEETKHDNTTGSKNAATVIAQTDGTGQIRFRVLAFPEIPQTSAAGINVSKVVKESDTTSPTTRLQRDIEVALHQRFSVNLNITSLDNIKRVMTDMTQQQQQYDERQRDEEKEIEESANQLRSALDFGSSGNGVFRDDASETSSSSDDPYHQIMKQYAEARHLARTREVRGGILVPSISFNERDDDDEMNGDGMVTFDTFFDANDQSFCTYQSMMHDSITTGDNNNEWGDETMRKKNDEDSSSFVQTKLMFHLQEGSVKLCFDDDSLEDKSTTMSGEELIADVAMSEGYVNAKEYALVTFGDCNISLTQSNAKSDVNIDVAYFAIDDSAYALTNLNEIGQGCIEIGSLFRFIEPYDDEDEVDGSFMVEVAPAPCFCLHIEKKLIHGVDGQTEECKIDLTLQPIEIIYRESTVRHLSNMAKSLSTENEASKSKASINAERYSRNRPVHNDAENSKKIIFFASLPNMTFLIPFDEDPISSTNNDSQRAHYEPLFDRCSYTISNAVCAQRASLGLTIDGICVETSNMGCLPGELGDIDDIDENGFSASFICRHAIVFAESPVIEERDVNGIRSPCIVGTKRVDILACSDESEIESQAVLKVDYHSSDSKKDTRQQISPNATNPFPLIPPLSSVKARQQYEPDDTDDVHKYPESNKGGTLGGQKIRGSDPQYAMSSDAGACDSHVEVHVPHLTLELTLEERETLVSILSIVGAIGKEQNEEEDTGALSKEKNSKKDETPRSPFGLALNFGQICIALHGSEEKHSYTRRVGNIKLDQEEDDGISYIMIADRVRSHILINSSGLRNVRLLSHDLTLYEASNFLAEQHDIVMCDPLESSAKDRCKRVRRRCRKNSRTVSTPIFYRSKLGCPLSPEMPAFLVDVLYRHASDESFYDGDEKTIHLSLYDMTYRYNMDSCWFNRFWCILQGKHYEDSAADTDELRSEGSSGTDTAQNEVNTTENNSAESSLTNLFVTFADCVIDYTSPMYFKRASRSLLRVGEIRVSSNIIAPAGPAQVYKISLGDVATHICNHRFSYNAENVRLSCARNLLREKHLLPDDETKDIDLRDVVSAEDVLQRMGFIAIIHLDSIDALMAFANAEAVEKSNIGHTIGAKKSTQQRPNLTMTLSFGQASVYACRDSFSCLTDTFGEWLLKYTTLPDAEMEKLRADAGYSGGIDKNHGENTPEKTNQNGQVPPKDSKTQQPDDKENKLLQQSSSMLEVMNNDMFMESRGTIERPGSVDVISPNKKHSSHDIPDSELSASELRKKHSMVQNDDVSIGFSQTPLIKNFYTIDTNPTGTVNRNGARRANTTHDCGSEEKNALVSDNLNDMPSTEAGLLLGGHSWTTVDHEWSRSSNIPPGEEQSAQWYSSPEESNCDSLTNFMQENRGGKQARKITIFPQHIPINPVSDPLSGGDMNAKKFAGTEESPRVRVRVIIKHLSVNARFFDGFDWQIRPKSNISQKDKLYNEYLLKATRNKSERGKLEKGLDPKKIEMMETRARMMGSLLEEGNMFPDEKKTFEHQPLPEERGRMLHEAAVQRSQSRRSDQYFQISVSGLKLRQDSFIETPEHHLASCMDLTMEDFFIAETISGNGPIKMFGEWLNESEHPRDSHDGLVMMKMVSMRPTSKISADGRLMSDESRVTLELLPLRFLLHQSALRFVRKFFSGDEREKDLTEDQNNDNADDIPGVFFQVFKVKPCKLKVDYQPEKVDLDALKHGSYVEIINLMPLNDMVLMLQDVSIRDMTGWGTVAAEMLSRWLGDICSTQMHKFLTRAAPFQPIVNLGGGMADLVIVPVEEIRQGTKLGKAVKRGTSTFAGKVAYEAVNTTSKLSKYTAKLTNKAASKLAKHTSMTMPSRPDRVPRNVRDTAGHAYESISRGLKEANYKVIILPYREWERSGPAGAARSVVRGIPVAVLAPISGASEALSYAALGLRNQMRPDVRVEEEAWRRGLQTDF